MTFGVFISKLLDLQLRRGDFFKHNSGISILMLAPNRFVILGHGPARFWHLYTGLTAAVPSDFFDKFHE
jgi:hypothetical protein